VFHRGKLTVSAFALAAGMLPTALHAQAAGSDDAVGLTEVVVTAQRREENLQKVPVSVSAFGAAEIKNKGITSVADLENRVPGFTFGRSGSDARPALRGVRTENVAVNGDTTIGYFVDGIYMSRAQQAMLGFVDLERVEIQRGPQGTLYGRNTFGGNISIATAKPRFSGFESGVDLSYGEFDRFRVEGFVNAPVSETIALRLAGAVEKSDGWVQNDNPSGRNLFDDDSRYFRAAVAFRPNDALTADLKFDYVRSKGAGGSAFGYKQVGTYYFTPTNQQLFNTTPVRINARPGLRDGVVDAPLTIDAGAPLYRPGNVWRIDTDHPTELDLRNYGFASNIAYDLGAVTVKSITGYTDFQAARSSDGDFSSSQIAIDYQLTAAKTFSQEFQLISDNSGPLTYVAGAYYFKDKLRGIFINQQLPRIIRSVTPNLNLPQNGGGAYDQQLPVTESFAGYGQASYAINERLKVTGGIRYTEDKKDFKFANANAVLPLAGTPGVPQTALITLQTGGIPASAFGTKGAPTNCTYTSLPAPIAGFQCLAANTTVLTGATYATKRFKKVTWRAGVDYELSDDSLLYASVSTGFRSGGFNSGQAGAGGPTFAPETVTAFEVGSKNRFFDNTLQLNVAAFNNRYSGLQEQRQIPAGGTTITIVENSGKSRARGFEVELTWQPVEALTLGGSFSYLDAKYTRYRDVALPFGTSILVTDATVTAPTILNGVQIAGVGQRRMFAPGYNCSPVAGTGGAGQPALAIGCDLSGKRIPYSPKYSGSLYAEYDIDLGDAGTLTPYASLTFSGAWYGQAVNSILDKQKAFEKIDLRLTWAPTDKLSLQGFVTNVTNEQTSTRFVYGGGGALQASYAPPRQWGARASVRF
jgi:iron complex outermembrane recepter protein